MLRNIHVDVHCNIVPNCFKIFRNNQKSNIPVNLIMVQFKVEYYEANKQQGSNFFTCTDELPCSVYLIKRAEEYAQGNSICIVKQIHTNS